MISCNLRRRESKQSPHNPSEQQVQVSRVITPLRAETQREFWGVSRGKWILSERVSERKWKTQDPEQLCVSQRWKGSKISTRLHVKPTDSIVTLTPSNLLNVFLNTLHTPTQTVRVYLQFLQSSYSLFCTETQRQTPINDKPVSVSGTRPAAVSVEGSAGLQS